MLNPFAGLPWTRPKDPSRNTNTKMSPVRPFNPFNPYFKTWSPIRTLSLQVIAPLRRTVGVNWFICKFAKCIGQITSPISWAWYKLHNILYKLCWISQYEWFYQLRLEHFKLLLIDLTSSVDCVLTVPIKFYLESAVWTTLILSESTFLGTSISCSR